MYPTAGNNFFVNRQVNVVKVEVAAAGANNKLDYAIQPPIQDSVYNRMILSANPGPAMTVHLRVTKIEGPAVDGKMRGVRFVELGVMQNGTFTQMHGDYDGFATPKRRVSSLEGKSFLD